MRICNIEGCGKKHHAKGLCRIHYDQNPIVREKGRKSNLARYHLNKKDPLYIENKKKIARRYILNNPDKVKEREEKHRKKVLFMRLTLMSKLGFICIKCGNKNILHLQLEHKNNDGAKERRENNVHGFTIKLIKKYLNGELDINRLQVMCANCNFEKRLLTTDTPKFLKEFKKYFKEIIF